MPNLENPPWYREPWFWLLISPLILVVVVSLSMATVAVITADDVVSDNYYKEGRMLSQKFTSEEHARSLGLSAELSFDLVSGEVQLVLNQAAAASELYLLISHPAEADLDLNLVLSKVRDKHYRADLPRALDGRWYIRLVHKMDDGNRALDSSAEKNLEQWRLHGEIDLRKNTHFVLE